MLPIIKTWRVPLTLILLTTVVFAVYYPLIHMGYVWDDFFLFVNDAKLRNGPIRWHEMAEPLLPSTSYFRPTVLFSFMLEFRYLGVEPSISHCISLAFFLANIVILFGIAYRYLGLCNVGAPLAYSAIAALTYGLHPALIESTAWISARFDVFATFWTLLAILLFFSVHTSWLRVALVCLCYALGLGSKEVAVVLPALLLCLELGIPNRTTNTGLKGALDIINRNKYQYLGLALILVAYLVLRERSVGHLVHQDAKMAALIGGTTNHILICLQTLFFYLHLVILPFASISPQHPIDFEGIRSIKGVAQATIAAAVILGACWGAWNRKPVALCILAGIGCLVPVLHIIPLTTAGNIGHERFLTLPVAFFCLALGCIKPLIDQQKSKQLLLGAFAIWLLFCVFITTTTLPMWQRDLSLWQWAYLKYPDNAAIERSFISAAMRDGRYDLAKPVFEKAIKAGPLNRYTQLMYGNYLAKQGNLKEAEAYIKGALAAYMPAHKMPTGFKETPVITLAISYWEQGFGHTALAEIYVREQRYQEAIEASDAALFYMPTYATVLFTKSVALTGIGNTVEADKYFAMTLKYAHPDVRSDFIASRREFISSFCKITENAQKPACANIP